MAVKGYAGRILRVDLSRRTVTVETPPESLYRQYLGGSALGLHYLLAEGPPQADPLGPDNILVFVGGPAVGAPFPGNSRLTVTAKSPLTGMAGDAQVGGYVAAELKFAGFDAVVVKGRADAPVYLLVRDGRAEIRDAAHLWGRGTVETEEALREELKDAKPQVLAIGPAGEKLSRMACVMHLGSRAAGRNGLGAVMGAKNLKAVVVRGTGRPAFADPGALRELARHGAAQAKTDPVIRGLTEHGSAVGLEAINASGGLPTRNYNEGWFEGAARISGPAVTAAILKDRETCYGCPVRCKRMVEVTEGDYRVNPRYGGAEYESLAALAPPQEVPGRDLRRQPLRGRPRVE
jgi:aldehyde:ferredoxin oxidoreductase